MKQDLRETKEKLIRAEMKNDADVREISWMISKLSTFKDNLLARDNIKKSDFVPEFAWLPTYGNDLLPTQLVWPKSEDLNMFPMDLKIKLESIRLKHTDAAGMVAIQLRFTNGVQSPLFEKDGPASEGISSFEGLKTYEINTSRKIRKISLKVV